MQSDNLFNEYLMKKSGFIFLLLALAACNEEENVSEKNRIIREQFDSVGRQTDSFNKKIQGEMDSAIQRIDSLILEVQKKKATK